MITSVQFQRFRVIEQATLPLGPFNLLLGPNGSGKTTAVRALLATSATAQAVLASRPPPEWPDLAGASARFEVLLAGARSDVALQFDAAGRPTLAAGNDQLLQWLAGIRGYVLEPSALAEACAADAPPWLAANGARLPAVLAALRDGPSERWTEFLGEVRRLMPEIVDVTAGVTVNGHVAFTVVRQGGRVLRPESLSHGTLVVFALLALALGPERPTLLCLEELERGIHPRLLRDVRDLLYRLSFPADTGDQAAPVQVLTTTHSPYVLDLFADTPEDVVIAAMDDAGAAYFRRLTDVPELRELLDGGRLGDLWYTGILGGVR